MSASPSMSAESETLGITESLRRAQKTYKSIQTAGEFGKTFSDHAKDLADLFRKKLSASDRLAVSDMTGLAQSVSCEVDSLLVILTLLTLFEEGSGKAEAIRTVCEYAGGLSKQIELQSDSCNFAINLANDPAVTSEASALRKDVRSFREYVAELAGRKDFAHPK